MFQLFEESHDADFFVWILLGNSEKVSPRIAQARSRFAKKLAALRSNARRKGASRGRRILLELLKVALLDLLHHGFAAK